MKTKVIGTALVLAGLAGVAAIGATLEHFSILSAALAGVIAICTTALGSLYLDNAKAEAEAPADTMKTSTEC